MSTKNMFDKYRVRKNNDERFYGIIGIDINVLGLIIWLLYAVSPYVIYLVSWIFQRVSAPVCQKKSVLSCFVYVKGQSRRKGKRKRI